MHYCQRSLSPVSVVIDLGANCDPKIANNFLGSLSPKAPASAQFGNSPESRHPRCVHFRGRQWKRQYELHEKSSLLLAVKFVSRFLKEDDLPLSLSVRRLLATEWQIERASKDSAYPPCKYDAIGPCRCCPGMDLLPIILSFISGLATGIIVLHQLYAPKLEEDLSKTKPRTTRTSTRDIPNVAENSTHARELLLLQQEVSV